MTAFQPTDEQDAALGLFLARRPLVVEAGAGTGKTSTLLLMAENDSRRGQYVAFNKAIVTEAAAKLPGRVRANTAHSLAYRAVGHEFAHRLRGSKRMPSAQVARALGINDPLPVKFGQAAKMLAPGFLASHAMRSLSIFLNSADPAPTARHVAYIDGIDMPTENGERTYTNNDQVAAVCAPAMAQAWADLCRPDGQLRYTPDCYLKLWQLSDPVIAADYVLFDEAQDASPVMLDIVARQAERGCQLVYVGDTQQQIYGWRGAINALARLDMADRTMLTQSFRFGQAIAEVANEVLDLLGADLRLTGAPWLDSQVVEHLANPRAVLCRTNATTVRRLLAAISEGRKPHLVGDGREVVSFARAVIELRERGWTPHPELTCFGSWGEVQDYVTNDPSGSDLALLVKLVDEFSPEVICDALEHPVPEERADLVLSTAHKSKGREWPSVMLAEDYPDPDDEGTLADEELRLAYVAATRAQMLLDHSRVAVLNPQQVAR